MPGTSLRTDGTDRLRTRAKITNALLIAFLIASALSIMGTIYAVTMGTSGGAGSMMLVGIGLIGLAWFALFVIAGIAFLVWLYRARANLQEAGQPDLKYSAGWSVASFFVPLVNFVVPMRTMRELHNRSEGEDPDLSDASVPSVASWWACHIAGVIVVVFNTLVLSVDAIPGVYVLTPPIITLGVSILGTLLLVGSAWFLRRAVLDITDAQDSFLNIENTFA